MKFINFPVVRFSVFLVTGILCSHFFLVSFTFLPFVIVLILICLPLWFIANRQLIPTVYFGIITYLCFFSIGVLGYQLNSPRFQPRHFSHFYSSETPELFQIKIIQSLKSDKFSYKYFGRVLAVNDIPTNGKILLLIAKDNYESTFLSDEILLVQGIISPIPPPLNPHQFDYSNYLKSLGVFGQIRISQKEIISSKIGLATFMGTAQNWRTKIVHKLEKTPLTTDERAIIQALVLGERKDIAKNLYKSYAAAGAVHILAVSGLHVGILYLVLAFVLNPLKKVSFGVFIHPLTVVILLWGFAMLSGLSPSVSRAVSMFSFFALANIFGRRTNSINILFLSFLFLLLINPLWIFQVGFQLSYLAVFFILWLNPILYKWGYSRYSLLRKIWSLVSVTLCAQIGVLPLSLYYFHQFPGLFLLTNIIILPFLTLLMCGGILVVVLALVDLLPQWLADGYNGLIEVLNGFVQWVSVQEDFLFKDISFSTLKVLGTYLLIISLGMLLKNLTYRKLILSMVAISVMVGIYIYDEFNASRTQFIIFQKSRKSILGYKNGKYLKIFQNDTARSFSEEYPVKSYRVAVNAKFYSEEKIPKIFLYNQKNILIVDSLGIVPKRRKIHTLILRDNPKINYNRLLDSLKPQQVIADGSNRNWLADRWEKTSMEKGIPFSYTTRQGAFLME